MPTIPPARGRRFPSESHQHRQMAESFGLDAERYDRTRPRYPDALVKRIAATVAPGAGAGRESGSGSGSGPEAGSGSGSGPGSGCRILDVGAGTGIAARQLQAAGCTVLGIEPDARMAALARRFGTEAEVATFEAWDPAEREFDAVVAGQSWHWIDPVAGAAKAARVLRPGGLLAAFWNVFQLPSELAEAFAEVCGRVLPDSPFDLQDAMKQPLNGNHALFAKVADGFREAGGFGDPEQWRFDWETECTRDAWLDQLPTQGAFTQLPPDKLAELLEGAGAAVDALGGSFTMRYATVAVTATRTPAG
ncbi:class I SAM-dependent methyltransferase [Streptomyces sp. NBC_01795]|uniref:class I SAM-dependent methyltransferase n=1 Tax=Streptomyces sp. NBC_01795 TaxID=2975943 RepID=UPI003FA34991